MTEPVPRPWKLALAIALGVWLLVGGMLVLASLFLIGACPHRDDPSFVVGSILMLGSPLFALVPAFLAWRFAARRRRGA